MIYRITEKTKYLVLSIFFWAFLAASFSAGTDDIPRFAETAHHSYSISALSFDVVDVIAECRSEITLIKQAITRNTSNRSSSAGRNTYWGFLTCLTAIILVFFSQNNYSFQQTVYNSHLFIIIFIHNQDGMKG